MKVIFDLQFTAGRAIFDVQVGKIARAFFNQSTLMRTTPINTTATVSDAATNRTANLL